MASIDILTGTFWLLVLLGVILVAWGATEIINAPIRDE